MLKFVRIWFRKLLPVVLWMTLIVWTLGGFVMMWVSFEDIEKSIIGACLGFIIGGLIIIGLGGYIATILNIDKNLQEIADNTRNNDYLRIIANNLLG